jgi:hypothetical protein
MGSDPVLFNNTILFKLPELRQENCIIKQEQNLSPSPEQPDFTHSPLERAHTHRPKEKFWVLNITQSMPNMKAISVHIFICRTSGTFVIKNKREATLILTTNEINNLSVDDKNCSKTKTLFIKLF